MLLAHQTQTRTPVVNFALPDRVALGQLLDAFLAANADICAASTAADRFPMGQTKSPRVRGGTTPESTLTTDGQPPIVIPARDWFYYSLEEIDRGCAEAIAKAHESEREQIEARFANYRDEFARQEKDIAKAEPRGKRAAERRLNKASRALERIEIQIINYELSNLEEAADLLEFISQAKRNHCFTDESWALHAIMSNVAGAIRRECGGNV